VGVATKMRETGTETRRSADAASALVKALFDRKEDIVMDHFLELVQQAWGAYGFAILFLSGCGFSFLGGIAFVGGRSSVRCKLHILSNEQYRQLRRPMHEWQPECERPELAWKRDS
jgi:hypothetical protein